MSKSDFTTILSLPLAHKAEAINKLAKQIKNPAESLATFNYSFRKKT